MSGQNATPQLMSLRTNTHVRTFRPVVYKPAAGIADSAGDKNSDRKFMFLSEETRADYR